MVSIRTLRANVNREQAVREFAPPGWRGFLLARLHGKLRRMATVYIPFRLYRVNITSGTRSESALLAIDSVCGALDIYEFDTIPEESATARIESRNHPPERLPEERARQMLSARLRRMVFRLGFFRVRELRITTELLLPEIHVPYWVGFRGDRQQARIAVMDAVRHRVEGAKVQHLLLEWLAG